MTEFQRTLAAVEGVEKLVADLTTGAGNAETVGFTCINFPFHPQPRHEPSLSGDDWIVIGSVSAFECQIPCEQRKRYIEAELCFAELVVIIEKMRRKCKARVELEALKAQMNDLLDVAPNDLLMAAQRVVDSGGDGAEALFPLLESAYEAEKIAIYGSSIAERIFDLLARFDAARATFDADVVSRIGAAVAAAAADEADRLNEATAAARRADEGEAHRAREEARRPVVELLVAANAQKMEAARANEKTHAELVHSCAAGARASLPRFSSFGMFS